VNLAVSQVQPLGVTVDANFVYWANFFDGRVMKAPIGGQGQAVAVFNGTTTDGSSYVAVNARTIFWTGYSKGLIYGAPIDGGAPVILVSGQTHPNDIVIDATRMYWTTQPAIAPMAPNPQGPTVMSALLDGTDVRTIAINQPFPYGVAVDAHNVYWTNQVGVVGNALTAPIDGDGGTTTIGYNQDQATGIAVDSTGVYWANLGQYQVGQSTGTGTIVRWPLDGGSPTVLASGQPAPHSIALDATRIYWTNLADGTVMKLAK
jgi:sugar lactone lactonase YvrE